MEFSRDQIKVGDVGADADANGMESTLVHNCIAKYCNMFFLFYIPQTSVTSVAYFTCFELLFHVHSLPDCLVFPFHFSVHY